MLPRVLAESPTLGGRAEAVLPAHGRFSRSWQLEHAKGRLQLPGLVS